MDTQEPAGQEGGGMGKYIAGVVAIAIIIAGISLAGGKPSDKNKADTVAVETAANSQTAAVVESAGTGTEAAAPAAGAAGAATPNTTEIDYTNDGFTPNSVTIKAGDTIKFINKSIETMWVGSNSHPSHTFYSGTKLREHCPDTAGTAFDQCGTGNEYSFTFTKAGSWNYHNHRDAGMEGTVVVTQ